MNSSYTISHTDAVLSFLKVGWCSTCWPHPELCSSPLTGSSVSPQSHWCSIHCLHIDICILKNSSWWLPLSQSSKTKSLILMLLEVLLEGWAPEPDLNLLWQKKKTWWKQPDLGMHVPSPSDIFLNHENKPRFASKRSDATWRRTKPLQPRPSLAGHPLGNVPLTVDALGSLLGTAKTGPGWQNCPAAPWTPGK